MPPASADSVVTSDDSHSLSPASDSSSPSSSSARRRRTAAEKEWLQSQLPDFIRAQALKTTAAFWPKIQRDYLAAFPILNMNNPNLTAEEKAKVSHELQARISVSITNFV